MAGYGQSNYKKTPCKFYAQGYCKLGDNCTFLHGDNRPGSSSARVSYTSSTTVQLSVSNVKGVTKKVTTDLDVTLPVFAESVRAAFNYNPDEVRIESMAFKGKPLGGPNSRVRTLREAGIKAGDSGEQRVFIFVRFHGGAPRRGKRWQSRSAEQEIIVQLDYMKDLYGVLSCAPEDDDIKTINMVLRGAPDSPYSKGAFQVRM